MLLYLADPASARSLHYQRIPLRVRAFEYFGAETAGATHFQAPTEAQIQVIGRSLNIWFERRRMGAGCRVFTYTRDHETWFLIRHGDYYRRESAVADDGSAASVLFRPEKFDILVYDSLTKEIRINARTAALRDRYRTTFSLELFGRENYFPETNKYSLEPITRDGPASMECVDVPGLNWARLTKLEYEIPQVEKEVRTHKAADVFNALASQQFAVPPHARLLQATFTVRFRDNPVPRSVTIKPRNVALYTDDDSFAIGGTMDKARKAVSNNIARVLKRVAENNATCARHLSQRVSLGFSVTYTPDFGEVWVVKTRVAPRGAKPGGL